MNASCFAGMHACAYVCVCVCVCECVLYNDDTVMTVHADKIKVSYLDRL
jgi:hypothetical protein